MAREGLCPLFRYVARVVEGMAGVLVFARSAYFAQGVANGYSLGLGRG